MTRIEWAVAIVVSLLSTSALAQTTVTWTGSGDALSFTDPSNWSPAPSGLIEVPASSGNMIINPDGLVNSYVVDNAFAYVLLQTDYDYDGDTVIDGMNNVTLDSLTAGGPLSLTVTQGSVLFAMFDEFEGEISDFGGLRGDGDDTYAETLIVNGGYFESDFISIGLVAQLDSGTMRLRGVGNPIASGANINFSATSTATLESLESPEDFVTEHLSKLTVDGTPATIGGNIEIVGQDLDFDTEADDETVVSVLQGVALAGPGDFNRDGTLDYQDWVILNGNLYSTLAVSAATDRFELGDTNNDGVVNQVDFVNFKTLVETQTGGSFASFIATSVPEPSTLGLLGMLAGAGLVTRVRRNTTFLMRNLSMSRFAGLLVMVMGLALAGQAHAVLVVEELFDYSDGPLEAANGGTGFSEAWQATSSTIGEFIIESSQAIYKGDTLTQGIITQSRLLSSPVTVDAGSLVTIGLDLVIGPNDTQAGRGVGLNFVSGSDVVFTIGKRVNGKVGLFDSGIGTASTQLGDVNFGSGIANTYDLTATLSYAAGDTLIELSDGSTSVSYSFVGEQVTFDTLQLTGYHRSTTGNGVDDISIDVAQLTESVLNLQIDPDGNASLVNKTGSPIEMDLYKIVSPDGNLDVNFTGIQGNDQSADGFPAGPGSGTLAGTGWEKAGGSEVGANLIGESYAFGTSTIDDDGTKIELGDILTTVDENEALEFIYHDAALNQFVTGYIDFVSATAELVGDYNGDGQVDLADYTVWRNNLGAAESVLANPGNNNGVVDVGDYTAWKDNFGLSASPVVAGASSVPEPSSAMLIGVLLGTLVLAGSRRTKC